MKPLHIWLAALLALGYTTAAANPARPEASQTEPLKLFIDKELVGMPGRVEVSIGELDPRVRLAPCARIEPYLPAGARLWGRGVVGVRCVEGAAWQTVVPVHVRVYAPALVAARPLAAGESVQESDLRIDEIELTREPAGVLIDAAQAVNKQLVRPIAAGQALRADQLRARPVVAAGDTVRVTYRGTGFAVNVDGRALTAAADGQTVRVQTESGKIVTGVARPGRVVEVRS